MLDRIAGQSRPAEIVLCLASVLFAGFLMTRLTKKLKLPNVTGYIFAGMLLGPYLLGIVPRDLIDGMGFVTDIALAYIAFGVGRYFKISALRKSGGKIFVITLFESLAAGAVITLAMIFIFHLDVAFSLLIGAIGCATAPASTIMTIRQYKAKGEFVDTILQVVALDDAVSLIAFSVCAAVARALSGGEALDFQVVVLPILLNLAAVLLGLGLGFLLHRLINEQRSKDHRLVLVNAVILGLTGLCTLFDISPLLSCMALGAAYINLSGNKDLFKQISNFSPPILLLFFVVSGMKLNIPALLSAGMIGVGYFLVRILGKYAGAFVGCTICRSPKPIRNYLGLALIPQAGVSIGLAALGERLLPPELGSMLSTIILSSAVLYEIIGPACAKAALFLSHTIQKETAAPKQKALPATEGAPAESSGEPPAKEPPAKLVAKHAKA